MSINAGSPGGGGPGTGLHQADGALSRAASEVEAARTDLTQIGGRLESALGGLRGAWQGAGGTAFAQVHETWQAQQQRIVGALDGLAESMRGTEQANSAADEAQAQALGRFAARLGGAA